MSGLAKWTMTFYSGGFVSHTHKGMWLYEGDGFDGDVDVDSMPPHIGAVAGRFFRDGDDWFKLHIEPLQEK